MLIFMSVVISIIIFFLAVGIESRVGKDSLPLLKYDTIASLCIIFVTVYLFFHIGPFLTEIARHRVYKEAADWFTYISVISWVIVFIFYLLGIYTMMKLLAKKFFLVGRRLFYWTIGILIIAFWAYMIHGITLWIS